MCSASQNQMLSDCPILKTTGSMEGLHCFLHFIGYRTKKSYKASYISVAFRNSTLVVKLYDDERGVV